MANVAASMLTYYQQRARLAQAPLPEFSDGVVFIDDRRQRLVLAQAGGYRFIVDLQPESGRSVLGLSMFSRQGVPVHLGMPQPFPAILSGEHAGAALSLGPAYKEADAAWVPLAGVPADWGDYAVQILTHDPATADFEVEYRIGGGPTVWERYELNAAGLHYQTRIDWMIGGFRLQCPVFVTDGNAVAVSRVERNELHVSMAGHTFRVTSLDAEQHWEFEPRAYANAVGTSQNAFLQGRSVIQYDVRVCLE